ncbi:MAG: hypothetical protein V1808_02305 [Candidatus Daviesbacteria bacterium]
MEQDGRTLHMQAAEAREKGNFLGSLEFIDQATIAYQKQGDKLGMAEVRAEGFLNYLHLYRETDDHSFLILARHAAEEGVEIAKESGDKTALALPEFNLGKAQEALGKYQLAVQTYKQALEDLINNPPAIQRVDERPAMVDDVKVHLATTEYKNGDKSALERAEEALKDMEGAAELSDYNKNVWLSGGHMRIAEILREDNSQKAKEHLEEAKKIIDSDERLKLRKQQWKKLAASFK